MLEASDLPAGSIAARIRSEYGLRVRRVALLSLGADPNSAVYRALTSEGTPYFVKLRRGPFGDLTLRFPQWLQAQGVKHILAPLPSRSGALHTTLQGFTLIVYPFVEGHSAYQIPLTVAQWASFGMTVRRLHAAELPDDMRANFPQESFSAVWRDRVRRYLDRAAQERFEEPVAREVAALLRDERARILAVVDRAEGLARALAAERPAFVACHADLHAGNLHLTRDGALFVVDWDTLTLAPKERDLMFIGGALLGGHREPEEEEDLFYRGYGRTNLCRAALAYYRYERIIQDIAAFCEELLDSSAGGEDRWQSLAYLTSNFQPAGTLAMAYRADPVPARP
ncbi:MAG TPA: aminoglycoside phosphotransferase family protein [Trueperaceae bacterium]